MSTEFSVDAAQHHDIDLSQSQTPRFDGRSAAALLAVDDLMARTGKIQWVEDLAEEFDIHEADGGRTPRYLQRVR